MKYKIIYTYYKSGDTHHEFTGTLADWEQYLHEQGGCFTEISREKLPMDFDEFLQDATLAVREMWEDRGGEQMGEFETQSLNDVLSAFFNDKK